MPLPTHGGEENGPGRKRVVRCEVSPALLPVPHVVLLVHLQGAGADAAGRRVDSPAAFLVDILSVNDAPTLDLNGLHRGGTGYSSTMGEHERVLGVALVDADLYVGDADGTLIVRGRVAYDPAGVGYSATDFPVSLF